MKNKVVAILFAVICLLVTNISMARSVPSLSVHSLLDSELGSDASSNIPAGECVNGYYQPRETDGNITWIDSTREPVKCGERNYITVGVPTPSAPSLHQGSTIVDKH
ncbi:hypothetical protein BCS42_04190 [Crenothrix sp. D3]|jgi:hypothetical protein|nr:hypothetical protein BCS42_04190 [Crenothrix sp. D3]